MRHCRLPLLALLVPLLAVGAPLNKVVDAQARLERAAAASQRHIDKLADDTESMLAEYKLLLRQYDNLKRYDDQVEKLVASQERELAGMEDQLAAIESTKQGVVPLMARMVDALAKFVALDLPFLPRERRNRVEKLQALLDRADISVAEKFRQILEAYQVEMGYGQALEAYTGEVETADGKRSVNFLRVGRVALIYQTLDGAHTAVWDGVKKAWQPLDDRYGRSVRQALRIARRQAPPELVILPVPAPEPVQ